MLFKIICLSGIAILILLKLFRNFTRLKSGMVYKTRDGEIVEIHHQVRHGTFDIFVSSAGVRYFSNGERVGDFYRNSPKQLFRRM